MKTVTVENVEAVIEKELASRDQGWDCMRNGPAISTDRAALAGGLALVLYSEP